MENNETTQEQNDTRKKSLYRRFLIPPALFILLFITSALVYIWFNQEQKHDPASEAVIRQAVAAQLNIDPCDLADEDFTRIRELTISRQTLCDLSLLEKFIALEKLYLQDIIVPGKGTSIIEKILGKVPFIQLATRYSLNLSPLEKLIHLRELGISYSNVSELESIRGLKKLKVLYLTNTKISNLKPLKKLKNLQTLSLDGSAIFDLEPLKKLKNLQILYVSDTSITNLKPLENLTNLQIININNTRVSDIEPLRNLRNLQILIFSYTWISSLKPLENLKNLRMLYLRETEVTSLEPLKNLTNLQIVEIYGCKNLTKQQVDDLKKALPNAIISSLRSKPISILLKPYPVFIRYAVNLFQITQEFHLKHHNKLVDVY